MKAISDKDFEIFVRRMAGELNFREAGDAVIWDCDHDPMFYKTKKVLMISMGYDDHHIAFFLKVCQEAKIKCDCDLMFRLDEI